MTDHEWGHSCCVQDRCENAAFASIGGVARRDRPERPEWVPKSAWSEFLRGYTDAAAEMWGPKWKTSEFGWRPALTINERR